MLKSKKERAFYSQLLYYLVCITAILLKPDIFAQGNVLTFLAGAGLCLASYHVTQGVRDAVVEYKHGPPTEGKG